jgi:hypothetical protein
MSFALIRNYRSGKENDSSGCRRERLLIGVILRRQIAIAIDEMNE